MILDYVDPPLTKEPDKTRVLLMAVRQALLIALGALEDYLGLPRTKQPKHG